MPITLNSEEQIHEYLIANFSPPLVSLPELEQAANRILELYPDVPALGSPFNTGNETFGLSSSFKRASAICMFPDDYPFPLNNFKIVASR